MPSSISSFRHHLRRRAALIGAAFLLLAAEVLVRWWRPDGTIPYELGGTEYLSFGPELAAFGAREVSVVGDSRAREAILAPVLSAAMTHKHTPSVANYSMSAALAEDTSSVVARLLRTRPRPRIIVYGVTPRVLSASKQRVVPYSQFIWQLGDWWRMRSIRGGARIDRYLPQTLRNELSERSRLFRLRHEVFEVAHAPLGRHDVPFHLRRLQRRTWAYPETPMRGGLPPWKTLPEKNFVFPTTTKGVRSYLGNENREPEWPHTYQEAFLDVIATACRNAHVPLVLVEIPASPALLAELPARAYPGFYEVIDRVSREYGAPFIRLSALGVAFDVSNFSEVSHVNLSGAERYTRALAKQLAPLVPDN